MATTEFIINTAYRLAGVNRRGQIVDGPQYGEAFNILNLIVSNWSQQNIYIFYETALEVELEAGLPVYRIGNNEDYEINTNPFTIIDYITYNVAEVYYTPIYLTPIEFDSIGFKDITTYPGYWSYDVFKDYTALRFFPRPTGSELFKIRGKQRLDSFVAFEVNDAVPDYAVLPLAYELASHLVVMGPSQPQMDFHKNLTYYRQLMIDSNQIDLQTKDQVAFKTWKQGIMRSSGSIY